MDSRVDQYLSAFRFSWGHQQSWENCRFVVLDTESTGLDARRDHVITIGSVAVVREEICLDDTFEVMMPFAFNTASVAVHGITREEASQGVDAGEAYGRFLDHLGDAVIVGHHIDHDLTMLDRGLEEAFGAGVELKNLSVDTMDLALRLADAGAFASFAEMTRFGLDDLAERFSITPHDRHTASGDAFITAQIFIRLLHAARRIGWNRLGQLCERMPPPE